MLSPTEVPANPTDKKYTQNRDYENNHFLGLRVSWVSPRIHGRSFVIRSEVAPGSWSNQEPQVWPTADQYN
jgi:hypothetical protein